MRGSQKRAAKLAANRRRLAAWRQRQATGEIVTPIPHVLDDTAEWMIRMGQLLEIDRDDRAKVEAAFRRWTAEMRALALSRNAFPTGAPRPATRDADH